MNSALMDNHFEIIEILVVLVKVELEFLKA
jgi:hypothetical protein